VATDDNDEIQITSYASLMQSGIVQDGDLWEAINDDDPDDIMPRPPQAPLSPDQIALIGQWIQQGAQNNSCLSACDTSNVTYSATIAPLVQSRCIGCHSGGTPQGGLNFTSWQVLNTVAMDGRLAGAVQHQSPFASMPPTGPMLPQCQIDQFLIWMEPHRIDECPFQAYSVLPWCFHFDRAPDGVLLRCGIRPLPDEFL
jgi:hypothetical protein